MTIQNKQLLHSKIPKRSNAIDYLRGVMIMLVVLDHAMHAYSPSFKNFWFIQDFGGSIIFDIWHMHNDAIMMIMLFFISGMFVIPSLHRHGLKQFAYNKFIRLCIPFIFGMVLIVPPQKYAKYLIKTEHNISLLDYWRNIYFVDDLAASGFWFLYYLVLLTIMLVLLHYYIPSIINLFTRYANFIINHPGQGICSLIVLSSCTLIISDFLLGAHWWIGGYKIFYVRGARFVLKALFFLLGAGFAITKALTNNEVQRRLATKWQPTLMIFIVVLALYITYSLYNFYDGAYNLEVKRHFYFGGTVADVWPIITTYSLPVIIRNILLAMVICCGILAYFSCFYRFFNHNITILQSFAICSYGIFIFHEPVVTTIQYWFYMQDIHVGIKFICTVLPSLFITWYLVHKIRTLPLIRKVL